MQEIECASLLPCIRVQVDLIPSFGQSDVDPRDEFWPEQPHYGFFPSIWWINERNSIVDGFKSTFANVLSRNDWSLWTCPCCWDLMPFCMFSVCSERAAACCLHVSINSDVLVMPRVDSLALVQR
jgi:hypothetical protein